MTQKSPLLFWTNDSKKPYVCHHTNTAEMAEDGCKVISEPFFATLSGEGMQTPPPKAGFIKGWNCMKFYFAALYFLQWILFILSNLAKLLRFAVSYIPAFLSQTQQKIIWTSWLVVQFPIEEKTYSWCFPSCSFLRKKIEWFL